MRNLVLLAKAKQDIEDAFYWYEFQLEGLGKEFLTSLENCFSIIRKNPQIFREVFKPYRRAVMSKFPYVIFYRISKECILIYAVFHCSQNPLKWLKRLKNL